MIGTYLLFSRSAAYFWRKDSKSGGILGEWDNSCFAISHDKNMFLKFE